MERQINNTTSFFNPAAVFAPAPINEDWIMEQLFHIRSLEKKIEFRLANTGGKNTTAIRRDMAELQNMVARFDQALDTSAAKKPALRAS